MGEGDERYDPMSPINLVLLGRSGNGKSATGNSIIRRNDFPSESSPSSVTRECMLQQTVLNNDRIINVIDTPGLFDTNVSRKVLEKELVRCIDLAKDGLHGVLMVFSIRNRFTPEELSVLKHLQKLFGPTIVKYMVVVFMGGDDLENINTTLEQHLDKCTEEVQDLLNVCSMRTVVFNNITTSETVKEKQLNELLKQIDSIAADNAGHPYSNDLFWKAQEKLRMSAEDREMAEAEQKELLKKMMEENLHTFCRQMEEELKNLKEQFAHEHRVEILKLEEELKVAREELAHLKNPWNLLRNLMGCAIM